jgi:AraC family ethanolamine operon transcriptional activator
MIIKRSHSLEEHIASFNEFNVDITQLSIGHFSSIERHIRLPKMVISRKSTNRDMLIHVNSWDEDIMMVSFPVNQHWQKIDGKLHDYDLAIIVEPENEMVLIHPGGVDRIDFHLVKSDLEEYMKLYFKGNETAQKETSRLHLNPYHLVNIELNAISKLANHVLLNAQNWNYQACLDVQDLFMMQISSFLRVNRNKAQPISRGRRKVIVKKALELIHDNPNKNYSVKDLCEYCFCSARSLENSFTDFLTISPKQYLIKRRLNLIRGILLQHPSKTVIEVVTRFGVTNMGRFSNDYYKFFGELPSATKGL